ncbi:MAG: OadG family protein [Candidatus Coproplasma sp.]
MLNNLLAIVQGDGSSWAGQNKSPENFYFDNWGEPFLYALIGFLVVFLGILIIIFTIWLVGLIMKKTNNLEFLSKGKKTKKTVEKKTEPITAATAESDGDIPDEVKAAIIAAIMAYYEEKQEKCEFTVKRIKRI